MFTELETSWPAVHVERWIAEARGGSRAALDRLFGACCACLLAAANQGLNAALRRRLDASDVVQDTLMEAWRDFPHFRGETEADFLVWLRRILRNNLANEHRRHIHSAMRSTLRESPLAEVASVQQPDIADSEWESPGTQAQTHERDEVLEGALRRLPEHYRQALCLHTQEGMTFAQVGERLRCSAEAARKLWERAAEKLARLLGDEWID